MRNDPTTLVIGDLTDPTTRAIAERRPGFIFLATDHTEYESWRNRQPSPVGRFVPFHDRDLNDAAREEEFVSHVRYHTKARRVIMVVLDIAQNDLRRSMILRLPLLGQLREAMRPHCVDVLPCVTIVVSLFTRRPTIVEARATALREVLASLLSGDWILNGAVAMVDEEFMQASGGVRQIIWSDLSKQETHGQVRAILD